MRSGHQYTIGAIKAGETVKTDKIEDKTGNIELYDAFLDFSQPIF